jgi:hypothetical protein
MPQSPFGDVVAVEMIRAEAETQRIAIFETQATIRAEIASSDPVQRW